MNLLRIGEKFNLITILILGYLNKSLSTLLIDILNTCLSVVFSNKFDLVLITFLVL